jgi:hypothetical protein
MNSQPAANATEPTIFPIYVVLEREMVIDAPAQVVWRHALNYASWQNYSTVEHVSGLPGQEGEVVLLKKEEVGSATTPYYARTIKLEPERRVVWKTFRNNVDYFGIVEFRLYDLGAKTRFCNNSLYEHNIACRNDCEAEAFRAQAYANMDALLAAIMPKLKKLAEQGA